MKTTFREIKHKIDHHLQKSLQCEFRKLFIIINFITECPPTIKRKCFCFVVFLSFSNKTSMNWPSQNFLLYIRTIIKMKVTEWINNLKKYINPPPLGIHTTCTNYNNLISKKSKRF